MYRILVALNAGKHGRIEAGALSFLDWLKPRAIGKLVEVGAIAPVAPPPLTILPGWKLRAERLARLGIVDVVELLEADSEELREALDYKRTSTIDGWKTEARKFIETPLARKPRR